MSVLFLPFMALSLILNAKNIFKHKIKYTFTFLYLIFFIFIFSTFAIGADNFITPSPYNVMFAILILITYLGSAIEFHNDSEKIKLFTYYLAGICVQSLCIIFYSYLNGENYGYGKLINPFTGNDMNSPSVSNVMGLSMSATMFYIFYRLGVRRIYSCGLFFIILAAGIFLSGRTFFLLSVITIFLLMVRGMSLKKTIQILILFPFVISLFLFLMPDWMVKHYDFALGRMGEGFESKRFKHWSHGIAIFMHYPFGGFTVDKSIESTNWYHNILLDTARVAGLIPVFCYVLFTIASLFMFYNSKKTTYKYFGFIMFVISFLIMQQDVIFEGEYRMLIVLFLSAVIISTKNRSRDTL
ncbi:O-antigen ligase family protein [Symbiopectobacterium purcellii]|uniref:O-antigen ligase family protein n=1 Tax=Symbiopectobacterium purcellii TaxID=2871826 RepID=UPI003F855DF2